MTPRLVLALAALTIAKASLAEDLVVWHAYRAEEKAALETIAAQYNATHASKGVTIKTLAVPFDALADKISAAVPRGRGADIFIYAQDRLGGWIETGNVIEPLDFFLDKATRARYLPLTLQAMTYRGTVYGLPVNFKVIALIYNKKLVPAPPKTTTELVAIAKKLTSKASGRFGLAYSYADFYYHAALMNGFGGRVFEAGPKAVIDNPQNIQSMDLLLQWIYTDKILPAEPSTALVTALFNEEKTGMVFSGPWFLSEISKSIDYGIAPLPLIDEAGGKPMRPWVTVEGAFIAAPCKNKDAAYEFIKYLTDASSAKVMAIKGRQTPANKEVYSDPSVASNPVLKAFKSQVDVSVPMPNIAEMSMMWSPVTIAIGSIVKRGATPKEALATAQKALTADMANLRRK